MAICQFTISVPKPKIQKGACFDRYSPKSGCRKFTLVNGEKKSTIEECCRSGGEGWSIKKKGHKNCISCQTVGNNALLLKVLFRIYSFTIKIY